jgi:hypothetical protein
MQGDFSMATIDCEVIEAESNGETLRVTLHGAPPSAADWRPLERQIISIPINNTISRTYHVGRKVTITIEPK